jgi:hypothetical protein
MGDLGCPPEFAVVASEIEQNFPGPNRDDPLRVEDAQAKPWSGTVGLYRAYGARGFGLADPALPRWAKL